MALKASDYVHLHNHTQYSLLDGLTKVPELIELVKDSGMEAVAITDHGTLSGVIEFYKTASAQDIRPIIGMETYVAARKHTDKDPAHDKANYHLILLAMNNTGYQNLMRLSSIANLDGFYYRPRIDHELLEKYNEGLIVLSGCIGGEVGDALRQGQYDQAKKNAKWYKKIFKDRYYLEIQDHGHPKHNSSWDEQVAVTEQTFRLAKELDIECVLTCDAHYLKHADQEAHEILLCVQTGAFLNDADRMSLKQFELHVTDPKEIIERWGEDHPEIITNTKAIAVRCSVEIDIGKILIPKFPVPKGETEASLLKKMVYRGLAHRYGGKTPASVEKLSIPEIKKIIPEDIVKRAEFELNVIEQMNFCGYFLIISDFINWGKNLGIVFGPGRGSAAGSIIAYSLRITELDPLAYSLLFERFLNPDRISMPDIDIDIQDSRRDEVIQYCVEKYGSERVANIVTFGRMAARNAVRDVARVLQVPYIHADRLAKMIPPPIQGRHTPLKESLKSEPDLMNVYETDEEAKRVFDLAVQVEGTIRSHGVHAAGVVIAPEEIVKYTPLEKAQKGVVATQYSMGPIEDLGLLKIDFLGLSNLTIIKNALRIIKRVYGQDIDIDTLPLDDEKTFQLFQHGDTTGVFQFESAGMKRYLKELKPTLFEDLIAMNALYRPGPMQWIDEFIARKHGRKDIEYLHPAMAPALKSTYGVIVYQEQVMQISKEMCGFTGGQADTLRKGIAKKIPEVLKKFKNDFIEGAVKTVGADRRVMEQLWQQLEAFASYAFPKAHASCYALIAYWTAYLKAHYPSAFMAALMTSDYDNTDRLAIEIGECERLGIEVLPPDINESFVEFAVVPKTNQIRFGLAAIKNVGTGAVEEILRVRNEQPFTKLEEFFARVNTRLVNRKTLESLVKAGAFDRFAKRLTLLDNLDVLLAYGARAQKQLTSGQTDLFGATQDMSAPKLSLRESTGQFSDSDMLAWERELLGVYLSEHPLNAYKVWLEEKTIPLNSFSSSHHNKRVTVGGAIEDIREISTKNNQKMAFVRLRDLHGEIELVLFPRVFEQDPELWVKDAIVTVKGKLTAQDKDGKTLNELKIIVSEGKQLKEQQAKRYKATGKKPSLAEAPTPRVKESVGPSKVYIRLVNSDDQALLVKLREQLDANKGTTEVILVVGPDDQKQAIRLPVKVKESDNVIDSFRSLVGEKNVIIS